MVSPLQLILLLQLMGIGLNNVAEAEKNLVKMHKPKLSAQCNFQVDDPSVSITKLSPWPRDFDSSQNLQVLGQGKLFYHPYLCCSELGSKDTKSIGLPRRPDKQWYCGARLPAGFALYLISWNLPRRTYVLSSR